MYVDIKSHWFLRGVLPNISLWIGNNKVAEKFQNKQIRKYGWNKFYEIQSILNLIHEQTLKNKNFVINGYSDKISIKNFRYDDLIIYYNNKAKFVTCVDSRIGKTFFKGREEFKNVLFK